jgi:protein SCO1/2
MSQKMAELQKELAGTDVRLVSFSVDPTTDRPAVLKEYGKTMGADESRWSLATTPDEKDARPVYELAAEMKLAALPPEGQNPIIHSEKFVLLDSEGWVRGYYSFSKAEEMKKLVEDARRLTRGGGK